MIATPIPHNNDVLEAEVAGVRNRVGERKEARRLAALIGKALPVEFLLVFKHCLELLAADVTVARSVDRIADLHVVGRDTLGNSAGGTAFLEESANDFLAGTDLCKSAIAACIQIDLERFLKR